MLYDIVFMLEEQSAKIVLEALLPKILPHSIKWLCIAHDGRADLQKSIPRKLKAWRCHRLKFVILHDQDCQNCCILKQKLHQICKDAGRPDCLIRIVCQELEAWYFGDLNAIEKAYPSFSSSNYQGKSKYRIPDNINRPKDALKRLIPEFQVIEAATSISKHMNIQDNSSKGFEIFISGVLSLVERQN